MFTLWFTKGNTHVLFVIKWYQYIYIFTTKVHYKGVIPIYKIEKTTFSNIKPMMINYYKNMTAPMDDMWEEGYIPECTFFQISSDETLGFFALNDKHVMLAFHLNDPMFANEIFDYIINDKEINTAYASTYDPLFSEQCNRTMTRKSINTILYNENNRFDFEPPMPGISMKIATFHDLSLIASFFRDKVDIQGDWIEDYLYRLINKKAFIIFIYKDKIIATSSFRPSISTHGIANIGMTTSKNFRRMGLASYVVAKTRSISNENGYHTICSTTIDNIGSQRTLVKCGYDHYHTIFTFEINK